MDDDIKSLMAAMADELSRDAGFLPSTFWVDINAKNNAMLVSDGIERFKRTVSNNYFNWLITSRRHPFFQHQLNGFLQHPNPRILATRPDPDMVLRLINTDAAVVLSARQRWGYAFFVALVWEAMRRHDRLGLARRLREPEVGDPIRIRQGTRLITQDLANSITEYNTIAPFLAASPRTRPIIGEIGAGYGRLAHVALNADRARYAIFDIPPALAVAQWYLERVLPERKIFRFRPFTRFDEVAEEAAHADLLLLTANQMALFPDGWFDLMLTISTLPELRPEQALLYLAQMARLSTGHVFIKQWMDWKNPHDGTHLRPEDYSLGEGWQVALDQPDPITPAFFNRVWSRAS